MILPACTIPSHVNIQKQFKGVDCYEDCYDRDFFKSYPHAISYSYNSRGFRDREWPDTIEELSAANWCIGDSTTIGIGSPVEHTWPYILEQRTGKRSINISMEGASNPWIARMAVDVLATVKPSLLILQWSFLQRDESPDESLSAEDRRLYSIKDLSVSAIVDHFNKSVRAIEDNKGSCRVIHTFGPNVSVIKFYNEIQEYWNRLCGADWPEAPQTVREFDQLPQFILKELKEDRKVIRNFIAEYELLWAVLKDIDFIPPIKIIDYARDHWHFDIETATRVIDDIETLVTVKYLSNL